MPMGKASGRHRDRHGRQRREGGAGEKERLRPSDRLSARGFRRQGRRADGRAQIAGRLRLGRQGHLLQIARLPRPLGLMVSFGQSSGAIGPVDIGILAAKGSLFLTRPTLNTYTAAREDLLTAARELFAVVESGAVKITINQTYPLREAA